MGAAVSCSSSQRSIIPASFRSLSRPPCSAYELPPKQTRTTASSIFSLSHSHHPQLSEFFIGSIIGCGGFGKIREIKRRRDGRWFALKSFEYSTMTMKDAQSFVNELLGLNRIPSHPFIIQVYAAFREESAVSYVMELLAGGDLRLLIHTGAKITEKMIAYVIGCMGLALQHVHSHGMVHRDFKPENVMFTTGGVPKLIDFGISFLVPAETRAACVCQSTSGTTQYVAPEALVSDYHCHGYESDFWSLGVVMFEMMYHKRPFETHAPSALVKHSSMTYQSTWDLLLSISKGQSKFPVELSESSVAPAHATNTESLDEMAVTSPSLDFGSLYRFVRNNNRNEEEEEEEEPASELKIALPTLGTRNAAPLPPPSDDYISLLHSLLDVRIEKRYGVGQNFALFCGHPFFASHDFDLRDPEAYTSPIHLNLEQVGMHVWTRFFAENLDESAVALNSSQCVLPTTPPPSSACNEIDEYLTRVQVETGAPLFYETRPPSRMRSVSAAIKTAISLKN